MVKILQSYLNPFSHLNNQEVKAEENLGKNLGKNPGTRTHEIRIDGLERKLREKVFIYL